MWPMSVARMRWRIHGPRFQDQLKRSADQLSQLSIMVAITNSTLTGL